MNWIKTSDRLPEDGQQVFFITNNNEVFAGYFRLKDPEYKDCEDYNDYSPPEFVTNGIIKSEYECPFPDNSFLDEFDKGLNDFESSVLYWAPIELPEDLR